MSAVKSAFQQLWFTPLSVPPLWIQVLRLRFMNLKCCAFPILICFFRLASMLIWLHKKHNLFQALRVLRIGSLALAGSAAWHTANQSDCSFFPLKKQVRRLCRIPPLLFEILRLRAPRPCCCPRSLPEAFCSLQTFPPSLICMLSVCSLVITDFFPEDSNLTTLLWSLSVFVNCIDLFFVVLLFCFF